MFAERMDVPPDVLVPPEAYGRGFCPHDAALVLDGWLRRLAAQDARGRTVLGGLARGVLRRRGHHELGFGRLGDYSRERPRPPPPRAADPPARGPRPRGRP